jgi:hypothetical protein
MRRLIALLVMLLMALAVAAPVLAAEPGATTDQSVIVVVQGDVTLAPDQSAAVLVVVQGDAIVEGRVGQVTVVGGTARIAGTVGDLAIVDGRAELLAGSMVQNDVLQLNSTVWRADGATVGGAIRPMADSLVGFGLFMGFAAILIWFGTALALLVAALLLAAFAARQVRTAGAVISREPVKAVFAGVAMVVLPPLLVVALAMTIVGLPMALTLLLMIWPTLAFIGYLVGAIWIGEWLLTRGGRPPAERPYLAAVIGMIIAGALTLIPLVGFVISVFGLGGVTVAGWRTLFGGPRQPIAYSPTPQPMAG